MAALRQQRNGVGYVVEVAEGWWGYALLSEVARCHDHGVESGVMRQRLCDDLARLFVRNVDARDPGDVSIERATVLLAASRKVASMPNWQEGSIL